VSPGANGGIVLLAVRRLISSCSICSMIFIFFS
jgi:hypothetical protein